MHDQPRQYVRTTGSTPTPKKSAGAVYDEIRNSKAEHDSEPQGMTEWQLHVEGVLMT